MALTIAPRSRELRSQGSGGLSIETIYTLGSVAGGMLSLASIAFVGEQMLAKTAAGVSQLTVAIGIACFLYGIAHLTGRRVLVPQLRWQVPKIWREVMSPRLLALSYGAILGLGFFTHISYATFWVAVGIVLLSKSPIVGVAIGACYGLGRAIPLLRVKGSLSFGASLSDLDRVGPGQEAIRRANAAALIAASLVILAVPLITGLGATY